MEDNRIIQLYWERNQEAIPATAEKYGRYCAAIAWNILGNREDSEECVNDTYLRAWNAMPPQRPAVLSAFLGKITRRLSLNRYRQSHAGKRGGGELPGILEELEECLAGGAEVEEEWDRRELAMAIDGFLRTLPARKRGIFLCRYWYADSVSDIAGRYGMKEGAVSMALSRMRTGLGRYLAERGFGL